MQSSAKEATKQKREAKKAAATAVAASDAEIVAGGGAAGEELLQSADAGTVCCIELFVFVCYGHHRKLLVSRLLAYH